MESLWREKSPLSYGNRQCGHCSDTMSHAKVSTRWGQRAGPWRRSSSGLSVTDWTPEVEPKLRMSRKALTDLRLDVEAYFIKKVN